MRFFGLARAHARIAARQRALWFVLVPLTAFAVLLSVISPARPGSGGAANLAFTGKMIAIFMGIAYAAAFANLFTAGARLGMRELEASAPVPPLALRISHVLGSFGVVVMPAMLALLLMGLVQTAGGQWWALPAAIGVTVFIVAPAGLIAMALSALAGALLPTAIGRIVAVLLWFYLVFSTPFLPIPSPNGTVLGVIGDTVGAGFFGAPPLYHPAGPLGLVGNQPTAVLSLIWQLLLILILLAAGSALAERARKQ